MTFEPATTIRRFSWQRSIWSYEKVQNFVSKLIRNRRLFMNIKTEGLCLDVGCGHHIHPSNINLDYTWCPGLDICCDITRGLPLQDSYVSGIFTSHCLEHIPLDAALLVLKEFYRVMKPGAYVRIVVPGLEVFVDAYNQSTVNGENMMPKSQIFSVSGIRTPAMGFNRIMSGYNHKFIYDFATMHKALELAGFSYINHKSFMIGDDPRLLLDTYEKIDESIYIEARKAL